MSLLTNTKSNCQTLSMEVAIELPIENANTNKQYVTIQRTLYLITILSFFIFYFYCVFEAFLPTRLIEQMSKQETLLNSF